MVVSLKIIYIGLVLGLVVAYTQAASISDNSLPTYDTIVVGLGASGTAAATTLARAGRRVLGLEAQERIGGRVYTVPFDDGVVEVGAEWIHGQIGSRTYELAVQNNVSIIADETSVGGYRSDGTLLDDNTMNLMKELVEKGMEIAADSPEPPEPLGQYITRKLMQYIEKKHPELLNDKEFLAQFFEYMDLNIDTYEATTSWNDVSTASQSVELEGNQAMSWHRNGYKTLFEILLNTYRNGSGLPTLQYKLNTEVTKITLSEAPNKVFVTCKDGSTYAADNVIVTPSVAVLKERHATLFSLPLPKDKVDAINNIKMGVESKIMFRYPNRWWGDNGFFAFLWRTEDKSGTEDVWVKKIPAVSTPMGASNVLTLWLTGDYAVMAENLPDDEVRAKGMALLRRFLGANITIPEPVEMLRSLWHKNPHVLGSFTYDDVDYPHHVTARADLARPITDEKGVPRILFAGEATHTQQFSTVHGAVDTGYREANRLLGNTV
ncbi:unnamed protein product [Chilo suppressalis]|uniref:Amine oxidase domain-containing protein n=1 Tax=Chilo suppressalis TaxID=168631 RepID=A0ABN8EDA5_CHISP|nr:unnamed protein product [Chilo suppressalis]